MLIAATARTGTVKEESWDKMTQGAHTYIADIKNRHSTFTVLSTARQNIDIWKYKLLTHNCEHFVKMTLGLQKSSSQVCTAIGGGLIGGVLLNSASKNPKLLKFLGAAFFVGSLALLASKVSEKELENNLYLS